MWPHYISYVIKLGTKLLRSLRLLQLGQGCGIYKGGGGGVQVLGKLGFSWGALSALLLWALSLPRPVGKSKGNQKFADQLGRLGVSRRPADTPTYINEWKQTEKAPVAVTP